MPYTIKKFNGQTLATIQDGTVDNISTNLQLPGKNYAGYGSSLNQSLVFLLENFANSVEPSNKVTGQLWFDTSVKKIKIYNGIDFKPLASTEYGATPPLNQLTGDLWFNTTTNQLFVYDGATHKLIGPPLTNPSSAQLVNKRLIDGDGNLRTILQAVFNESVIAVFSKDEFNIDVQQTPVAGFTKIYKGITLPSRATYPNVQFGGVAKTSESLIVGTVEYPASNFLQNVGNSQVMNTDLKLRIEPTISNTGVFTDLRGLFLGGSDNFYIGYNSGIGYISNLTGGSIALSVTNNGTLTKIATVDAVSIYPNIDSTTDFGTSAFKWKNVYGNNFYAIDDPTLAPNNSAFRGRVIGTSVTATAGFVGNITGNITGNVLRTNGTIVVDVSSATPVFTGRTNGPHYGNVINVNAASGNQTAIDVSGTTTIFRGSFSGVSETASALSVAGVPSPLLGFIGSSTSTNSNFFNTVACRDGSGDLFARNFKGIADKALAVVDENGISRLASIGSAPYTVVIRDSNGSINAANASSAESADTLNGMIASVPNVVATIVARDAAGDIFVNIMHGIATSARYADLAEMYLADAEYEVGTVMMIGGEKEVTASKWGKRAIGAVSEKPAYLMNKDLVGGTAIALKGRVPVKVIGSIKKGDELIASNDGYAVMAVPHASGVFAVALESSDDTGVKLVECLVL
jgi:hypothetical protein